MSRKLLASTVAIFALGSAAHAEAPAVAVDIAPIHSLVSRVMEGVGTPSLVIPPGASPHEHALRPSEAAALEGADLVFWVGEDLTPWLEEAVETLAGDAAVTALLDVEGTVLLDVREDALFEAHEHGHDDHDHDAHDHDHDHGHDESGEADHDHDHAKDGAHAHGGHDPHAWLSPENAETWLNIIAAELSSVDPQNADTYAANAAAALEEMAMLKAEITAILAPVSGKRFIVFHDAYQYFERAFDFPASGAISLSDAADPSPARIADIQERVRSQGIDCVLAEPQFNAGLVAAVLDGTETGSGILDPLGSTLEPGPELYPTLMRNLAGVLADCL